MGEQQRIGQALFNGLYAVRPDIADAIRGSDTDPFHDDSRLPAFLAELGRLAQWGERQRIVAKVRALGCVEVICERWPSGEVVQREGLECHAPQCPIAIADMIEKGE